MNTINRSLIVLFALSGMVITPINAQSPQPIVVQAATAAPAPVVKPVAVSSESTTGALKILQELKASNAETLKKQEAVLQQLDDLQKAAEELRIFAKRG